MSDISEAELPEDFYKRDGWVKTLIDFYAVQQNKLTAEALQAPVEMLAKCMDDCLYIGAHYPDILYNALKQCVDPMFSPEEYKSEVYDYLIADGIMRNRPPMISYAESLHTIRKLFARDEEFYQANFAKEIELVGADKFGSVVQEITKSHVKQIRKMIEERE